MAAIQRRALPAPRPFGRYINGKLLVFVAVALMVGIAMAQVNQFSRMASTGYQMETLRRERAEKQAANHQIEAEVARLSSLARVDWEARVRMGMTPPTRKLNIEVNTAAPARALLPTRFLPPPAAEEAAPAERNKSLPEQLRDLLPF